MRIKAQRTGLTMLCGMIFLGMLVGGCSKKKKASSPVAKVTSLEEPQKMPKELVLYLGFKNLKNSIDNTLAVIQEFAPLPFSRDGILDLMMQKANLPRELLAQMQIEKPFWMLSLDGDKISDKDAVVFVIPINSPKAFEQALLQKMNKSGNEGGLTVYKPKPGALGIKELKFHITEGHAILASSRKAFEATEKLIRDYFTHKTPDHDAEAHVLVENIMESYGPKMDQLLGAAMNQLQAKATAPHDAAKLAQANMGKQLERYAEMLKTTHKLLLSADLTKSELTITGSAFGLKNGHMVQVIKRQRTGDPLGYKLLPSSSWFVMADHDNPESLAEQQETWTPIVDAFLQAAAPEKREAMLKALTNFMASFTGDYTLAAHPAPSSFGLTISAVMGLKNKDSAQKGLATFIRVTSDWVKGFLQRSEFAELKKISISQKAFQEGGAAGTLFRINLPIPNNKKTEVLKKIIGNPLMVGVAFNQSTVLMTMGIDCEAQLKTLIKAQKSKISPNGLDKNSVFTKAMSSDPHQVGMIYFSLLDMVHWITGIGIPELKTFAKALEGQKSDSALAVSWGVDEKRTHFDLKIHLPFDHFLAFKPIIQAMQQKKFNTSL